MPSNAFAFGFLAFLAEMSITLWKSEMVDLQAISCYPLLQVSKLLPRGRARLIHSCHVFETALVEMFVNLTFESDRQVHSMSPFCKSTEDLESEASETEETISFKKKHRRRSQRNGF